ncbi:MAG TPA: hypothetical protein VFR41_14325 [Acidimicrobiia bacterium]|nr:hypothetical protein [Acidimicrobiia bacterium]
MFTIEHHDTSWLVTRVGTPRTVLIVTTSFEEACDEVTGLLRDDTRRLSTQNGAYELLYAGRKGA